jgi:hypothetical protein
LVGCTVASVGSIPEPLVGSSITPIGGIAKLLVGCSITHIGGIANLLVGLRTYRGNACDKKKTDFGKPHVSYIALRFLIGKFTHWLF